jgi:hypothetical protein
MRSTCSPLIASDSSAAAEKYRVEWSVGFTAPTVVARRDVTSGLAT